MSRESTKALHVPTLQFLLPSCIPGIQSKKRFQITEPVISPLRIPIHSCKFLIAQLHQNQITLYPICSRALWEHPVAPLQAPCDEYLSYRTIFLLGEIIQCGIGGDALPGGWNGMVRSEWRVGHLYKF